MAEIILTGSCGDNATFNLYDDGLLEILGTGAMTDYAYSTSTYTTTAPWVEYRYSNPIKTITIAEGITTIGDFAFYKCAKNLTSISISNTVTSIGKSVLMESNDLTSLTIPSSVTTIKSDAFRACRNIEKITMLGAVPTASSPFLVGLPMYSGKGKILVPYKYIKEYKAANKWKDYANLIQIGSGSLADLFTDIANSIRTKTSSTDKIIAYNFPEEINKISSSPSVEPNQYSSIISSGEAIFADDTIPQDAFDQTKIHTVTIKNGVTTIDDMAFSNCNFITNITIPDSVTTIGIGAFSGCTGLTSITIPGSVSEISWGLFSGCAKLETVKLGNGVNYINDEAFSGCTNLTYLYLYDENYAQLDATTAFSDEFMSNGVVLVPESLLDIYQEDEMWSQFNISTIEEMSE